jgi:hypothetical protein
MEMPMNSNGILSGGATRQTPKEAKETLAKVLAALHIPELPEGFRVSAAIVVMVLEDGNGNQSGVNAATVGEPMSIPARLGSLDLAKQMIVEQLFKGMRRG